MTRTTTPSRKTDKKLSKQKSKGRSILGKTIKKNGKGSVSRSSRASTQKVANGKTSSSFTLPKEKVLETYRLMTEARLVEERVISMFKQSHGYFWIGGPGEEAFNVPLGLQIHKGQGLDYDFMHFHYRSSSIMHAMGEDPIGSLRQMKNTATDPYSGGRNFSNHFSKREWNVCPIASTIETQYATAIGTGIAHARHGGKGITIVNGGDAGTAEGEFASCLYWASRPGKELPILIIVANNQWGISTSSHSQIGDRKISDRAIGFGIERRTINGNDMEESWFAIEEAMDYVRNKRKPYFIEARVSRLYGHSSATGCNFVKDENDCNQLLKQKILKAGLAKEKDLDDHAQKYSDMLKEMANKVIGEPLPEPDSIYDHTYYGQKGRYW